MKLALKLALFATLAATLLEACGGKSSGNAASDLGAERSAPADGDRSDAEAAGVEDLGAGDVGGSAPTAPDCGALRDETLAILSAAVADAPLACAAQSDCVLYGRRPNCVYDCGFFAAASDPSSLDAVVDRVDAELCPEACVQVPSSCGGGTRFEDVQMARCDAGECVIRSWSSVYQPVFEATVYPLLGSHCQDCHGAAGQSGAPPFAHPDVARALTTTNQLVDWRGRGPWVLDRPESSALVRAVGVRNHGCWSDCAADADELVAALLAWSQGT